MPLLLHLSLVHGRSLGNNDLAVSDCERSGLQFQRVHYFCDVIVLDRRPLYLVVQKLRPLLVQRFLARRLHPRFPQLIALLQILGSPGSDFLSVNFGLLDLRLDYHFLFEVRLRIPAHSVEVLFRDYLRDHYRRGRFLDHLVCWNNVRHNLAGGVGVLHFRFICIRQHTRITSNDK